MSKIPSIALIPSGVKATKIYSVLPVDGSADLTFDRGTSTDQTRVNNSGLIEDVAQDVPRLDYLDGGCPSLLLEPSTTNLVTYSEDFSKWSLQGNTLNLISGVAPDGNTSVYELTSVLSGKLQSGVSALPANTEYTFSFYVKQTSPTTVVQSRILSQTGGSGGSNLTQVDYQDQLITDEWVRITHTFTTDDTSGNYIVYVANNLTVGESLQFWGAQVEALRSMIVTGKRMCYSYPFICN